MTLSMRAGWIGLLLVSPLAAQSPAAQADSAWTAGDRGLARRLYAAVLETDPNNSHAIYRAAELSPDANQALRYLGRYLALEPTDPWGWIAVGDLLSRRGKTSQALEMFGHAEGLAPGERDVHIGRARVLSRGGRRDEALAEYRRWLTAHADDAEAWSEAGREWLRAGKPGHALKAFARAEALGRTNLAAPRALALAGQAAVLEPMITHQRDSDGNRTTRIGLTAEVAAGDGGRIGLAGGQSRTGDGLVTASTQDASIRVSLHPRATTQVTWSGGAVRLASGTTGNQWLSPIGEARLRWHAPGRGAALELRAERRSLGATPLLVANHAVRNEGRALLNIPLGPVRARTGARMASIQTSVESNTRWGVDEVLAVPFGWAGEVSVQYHGMHYAKPSTAGYFAPDRVETIEGGSYFELDKGGVSFAADLGAGAQRVRLHGAVPGPWRGTLRGWAYIAVPFAPGWQARGELEASRASFAPDAVTTSANWRYLAASATVRLAIR